MSKFCTKCGAPLEEGMRFCTKCGAPIVSAADRDTSGIDRMVDGSQTNSAPTYTRNSVRMNHEQVSSAPEISVAPTMQMPPASPYQQTFTSSGSEQVRYAQSIDIPQKRGLPTAAKAIIAAIIIVLLGASIAALVILHPWDSESSDSESDARTSASSSSSSASSQSGSSSTSRDSSSASSSSSSRDESSASSSSSSRDSSSASSDSNRDSSSTATSDADLKSSLTNMLGRIDAFDTRVANTATNYNSHILGSAAERQSGYNSALSLQRDIESAIEEINALTVSTSSRYYEAWTLEKRLLDDLYHRIYVMQKGWERSLSSNDIDYINEYIAADNVNGVNRYKTDYDETRPRVSIPN